MQLVEERPNVELRRGADGETIVVLAFPYDPHIVALVRAIPQRRFDWDKREWWAPVDDWAGVHVAEVLDRFPELTTSAQVDAWLAAIERRWVGRVSTTVHDGRGWWVLRSRAGTVPEALQEGSVELDGALLAPFTAAGAQALADQDGARLDPAARRCLASVERGEDPPPARLAVSETIDGTFLRLDVLWDHDAGTAFDALPGAGDVGRTLPVDPWIVEQLDAFMAAHGVAIDGAAASTLKELRDEYDAALAEIRASRTTTGEPIASVAAVLGGELAPFQWGAVRYALRARRTFLADEQGLGTTVEALATV